MSCFGGCMKEYERISLDRFDGKNLDSTVYFLSHLHSDHTVGLDAPIFHKRLKTNKNVLLYCSEVTEVLLLASRKYKHLGPYIKSISINTPTILEIPDPLFDEKETVTVTFLPAFHCPGSVMCMFEGHEGTVIYTGDFRWEHFQLEQMHHLRSGESVKHMKSLYVDTTFCTVDNLYIPSRQDCIDAVFYLVQDWISQSPQHVVYIGLRAQYGHEPLLNAVAVKLNRKVHVDDYKVDVYDNIEEFHGNFTKNGITTQIHACSKQCKVEVDGDWVPCRQTHARDKVLYILPTTMYFTRIQHLTLDKIIKRIDENFYRACYSFHSSYQEIMDLLAYLKPDKVFPNVKPPDDSSLDVIQHRLNSMLKECKASKYGSLTEGVELEQKQLGILKTRKGKADLKRKRTVSTSDSESLDFGTPVKERRIANSCTSVSQDSGVSTRRTRSGGRSLDTKADSQPRRSRRTAAAEDNMTPEKGANRERSVTPDLFMSPEEVEDQSSYMGSQRSDSELSLTLGSQRSVGASGEEGVSVSEASRWVSGSFLAAVNSSSVDEATSGCICLLDDPEAGDVDLDPEEGDCNIVLEEYAQETRLSPHSQVDENKLASDKPNSLNDPSKQSIDNRGDVAKTGSSLDVIDVIPVEDDMDIPVKEAKTGRGRGKKRGRGGKKGRGGRAAQKTKDISMDMEASSDMSPEIPVISASQVVLNKRVVDENKDNSEPVAENLTEKPSKSSSKSAKSSDLQVTVDKQTTGNDTDADTACSITEVEEVHTEISLNSPTQQVVDLTLSDDKTVVNNSSSCEETKHKMDKSQGAAVDNLTETPGEHDSDNHQSTSTITNRETESDLVVLVDSDDDGDVCLEGNVDNVEITKAIGESLPEKINETDKLVNDSDDTGAAASDDTVSKSATKANGKQGDEGKSASSRDEDSLDTAVASTSAGGEPEADDEDSEKDDTVMDMEVDMSDDDWNEEIAKAIFESIKSPEQPSENKGGAKMDKAASEDNTITTEKESQKKQIKETVPKTPVQRLRFSRRGSFDFSGELAEDKEFGFVSTVPKDLPDPNIYKTKWSYCFQPEEKVVSKQSDTLEHSKSKSGEAIDGEKITIDDNDDNDVIDLTGDDFGMDQGIIETSKERKDAAVSYNEKDGKKLMKISFSKSTNPSVKCSRDGNNSEKKKDPDKAEKEEENYDESNNVKVNFSEQEIVSDSVMKDDTNTTSLKAETEAVSSVHTSHLNENSGINFEKSSGNVENHDTEKTIAVDKDFSKVSDPVSKSGNDILNDNKSDLEDFKKSTQNKSEAISYIDGKERKQDELTDNGATEVQENVPEMEVMPTNMGQQSNRETPVAIDNEIATKVNTIETHSVVKNVDDEVDANSGVKPTEHTAVCESLEEKSPEIECINVGSSQESSQEWLSCSKVKEKEQLDHSSERNSTENNEKLKNERDSQTNNTCISSEKSDTCTDRVEDREITVDLSDVDVVASVDSGNDGKPKEITVDLSDVDVVASVDSGNDGKPTEEPITVDLPFTVDLTDEDIIALAESNSDTDDKITPVYSSKELEDRAEVKRQAMGFVCETDSDSDSDSTCPPSPSERVIYDDFVELSSESDAENDPSVNQDRKQSDKHATVGSDERSKDSERTHSSSGWLTSRVTTHSKTVDSRMSEEEDEDIARIKHLNFSAWKKANRGQPIKRFKPGIDKSRKNYVGEDNQHGKDHSKVRKYSNIPTGIDAGEECDKDENSEKDLGFGFKNRNRRIHYRKQFQAANQSFVEKEPSVDFQSSRTISIQSSKRQMTDKFSKPYSSSSSNVPPLFASAGNSSSQASVSSVDFQSSRTISIQSSKRPMTDKFSKPYNSSSSTPLFPSARNSSSQASVSYPSQVTDKYSKSHTSPNDYSRNKSGSRVAPVAPPVLYNVPPPSFVPVSRSPYALSASSGSSSTISGAWPTSHPNTSSSSSLSDLQSKVLEMTGLEISASGTVQPMTVQKPEPVVYVQGPEPVVSAPEESLTTLVNKLTEVKELLETVSQSEQLLQTVSQTEPDVIYKDYAHSSTNMELDDRNRAWSLEDDARTRYERQREHRRYEDDYLYRQEEEDRMRYDDSYRRPYQDDYDRDDYDRYHERYAREPRRSHYEEEDPYYSDRYERSRSRHDYPHPPHGHSRPGYHVEDYPEEFLHSQEPYEHDFRPSEHNFRPAGHRSRFPLPVPRPRPSPVRPPTGKPRPLLGLPNPRLGSQGLPRPRRPLLPAPRATRPVGPNAPMNTGPRSIWPTGPIPAPAIAPQKVPQLATVVSTRTGKVLAHNKVDLNPNAGRDMVETHMGKKDRSNMPAFLTGISSHSYGSSKQY